VTDAEMIAQLRALVATDDGSCVIRARIVAEATRLLTEDSNGY
jgi:hypothetical protein